MADDTQDSVQGTEDDPFIELGEDKVKRSELIALREKAANLDKDYTEKTTQLAKDKVELDKQFASVKDLAKFAKLVKEDPEEAERQMRYILKKYKGGNDDDDDGDGTKVRHRTEGDEEREQRLYDLELKIEIQELSKDPVFKENEEEIMNYAVENEISSVKMAFKSWKGENFDKLHESRLQSAKKKKEEESDIVLKGGTSAPGGKWEYDQTKTIKENLILLRQSKK